MAGDSTVATSSVATHTADLWQADVARQAHALAEASGITLENIRNSRYPEPGESYDVVWETRHYAVEKLKRLWFLVEPFHPTIKAIAHTFISFEFEDDFLALSIEARLKQGQTYSIIKGFGHSYALSYVFGDERDLILRRTKYLAHELYLYPMVTPPLEIRALFLNTLATANALRQKPRHYHSARTNCTSTLRQHANGVRPGSFPPFIWADVLPGRSDKVLLAKGWLDTNSAPDALRAAHAVKAKANRLAETADFSRRIREGL